MGTVLKEERQQLILDALEARGRVDVAELSQRFSVSAVTIRRDLRELGARGTLRRAYGGAVALAPQPPVIQRMACAQQAKARIGRIAAGLVEDGMSVFIGSGTTTAFVARNLLDRENLTVVTNALNVASELASARGVTVVVTGGVMRSCELSLVGHIAEQSLREVRVDKVIIGMRAIDPLEGLTNDYLPEVMTDRAIIAMAPELIVVADHTKLGKVASAYVAPAQRITTLVTDREADPDVLATLEGESVRIIIADHD